MSSVVQIKNIGLFATTVIMNKTHIPNHIEVQEAVYEIQGQNVETIIELNDSFAE